MTVSKPSDVSYLKNSELKLPLRSKCCNPVHHRNFRDQNVSWFVANDDFLVVIEMDCLSIYRICDDSIKYLYDMRWARWVDRILYLDDDKMVLGSRSEPTFATVHFNGGFGSGEKPFEASLRQLVKK